VTRTEALTEAMSLIANEIETLRDRRSGFDHRPYIERLREAAVVLESMRAAEHEAYR
jgi:hypothetical protein